MPVLRARSVADYLSSWLSPGRDTDPNSYAYAYRVVRLSSGVGFGFGILVLLGWAFDLTLLKSGLPGESATQPVTAVCFTLCSLALGLSTGTQRLSRALTDAMALVVLTIVVAVVWQNALDDDWGLDRLLFSDAVIYEQPGPFMRPGRPAAGTLIGLVLLCACLLLVHSTHGLGRRLYVGFATAGVLFASALLTAYALGLKALYPMGFYAHTGLNSGLELGVLFFGVLLRRPENGWIRQLTLGTPGAATARRILLWSAATLLVLAVCMRLAAYGASHGAGAAVLLIATGGPGILLASLLAYSRRLDARTPENKGRSLSQIAHELRNPLAPLSNGVHIMRQLSAANPRLLHTTEMMTRQLQELVRLVDELTSRRRVMVPMLDPELAERAHEGRPAQWALAAMQLKIVLAEDNPDGAATLAAWLRLDGHEVWVAPNGRVAVELAERIRPDVILMDIDMPELDGLEATRCIRATPWGRHVRIVAVTAWERDPDSRWTAEAGMDFHLVKPVDPRALASVLGSARAPDS